MSNWALSLLIFIFFTSLSAKQFLAILPPGSSLITLFKTLIYPLHSFSLLSEPHFASWFCFSKQRWQYLVFFRSKNVLLETPEACFKHIHHIWKLLAKSIEIGTVKYLPVFCWCENDLHPTSRFNAVVDFSNVYEQNN